MAAGLALGVVLVSNAATPALAYEVSGALSESDGASARSFLQLQEYVRFSCGVVLHINYTYNDTYGTISGITKVVLRKSNGMSNVSWVYQRCSGGDYYLFTLTYKSGGSWKSQTAKLWA